MNDKIIGKSIKYTSLSEIFSKLIGPITTMILARLLVPEDFGILAIITMCLSLVDIFTDSGFSRYIIFKQFKDEQEKDISLNVAFWSNLTLSFTIYILMLIFANQITYNLFNIKDNLLIKVAGLNMFITSFSAIQNALLKKEFSFKKYFFIRITYSLIPLVITVPLAFIFRSYWSLIIGNIINALVNSILLTFFSSWRPSFKFDFNILKKIFKFCSWFLLEGIVGWLMYWIDAFIVSIYFSKYFLGIYKNTTNIIISIMSIVGATITTVLFTSLTKLRNNEKEFIRVFSLMNKITAYFILPMACGMFVFDKVIVNILFGAKWMEASKIFGLFGITYALNIIFIIINSEAFAAIGMIKMPFIIKLVQLGLIISASVIGANINFENFIYFRCGVIILQIISIFIFMYFKNKKLIKPQLSALINPLIACLFITCLGFVLDFITPKKTFIKIFIMIFVAFSYVVFVKIFKKKDYNLVINFIFKNGDGNA